MSPKLPAPLGLGDLVWVKVGIRDGDPLCQSIIGAQVIHSTRIAGEGLPLVARPDRE